MPPPEVAPAVPIARTGPRSAGALRRWRLPEIDTWPRLVGRAQTFAGRLAIFVVCAVLMKLHARGMWFAEGYLWLLLIVAAAVVSSAGRYRHIALLGCAAVLFIRAPDWVIFGGVWHIARIEGEPGLQFLRAGSVAIWFLFATMVLAFTRRYRDYPLASRPVLTQHIAWFILLGLAASPLLHGVPRVLLWCFVAVFSAYFWMFSYALIDQRHRQPASLPWHLATFNPFAWPTPVPMGKGAATWRSVEAGTAEELAVTQLKGVKLLVWALILKGLLWAYREIVYGEIGVPRLTFAFRFFLEGGIVPPQLVLGSVVANFFEQLLQVALWGHVIIAVLRLAGFRLLRNTCRPLSARTIADFWNRYLYYFKEALVQIYFYPTYVRHFRRYPRLRLAFATFMAAGVGNFTWHFIGESHLVAWDGFFAVLARFQTYAFYCAMLVTGIVISQLRTRAPDPSAGWLRARFVPSLGVITFFCFLSFFDGPTGHAPLVRHFEFLFQLTRWDLWFATTG